MEITFEKPTELTGRVKINVLKQDIEPRINKQLKEVAKYAGIKGFRPGMVPLNLVKKMYGNGVMAEEVNKYLSETVNNFIRENNYDTLGQPMPLDGQQVDIDIHHLRDFDFTFEIGLQPHIDLSYLEKAPTFTKYKIKVDETKIDEEVERIRRRFATYAYPETIEDNDILTFSFRELNEDGSEKDGGIDTSSSVMLDLVKPEHKAALMALQKDGTVSMNVFDLMDRDRDSTAKHVLNQTDASVIADISNLFRLTLNNIVRSVPAEINEEFFEKVYGGKVKTMEEMREEIRKDYESYFDGQCDSYLVNDLYKGLMGEVKMELPDAFLKRWIERSNEKPTTAEEVEKEYPKFAKQIRWDLITSKIAREQNFQVSDEELRERVRANVTQQLYGYGMRGMGDEWIDQFVQKQMQDEKYVSRTQEQILDSKVMEYIKGKVKLNEQVIGLDEFNAKVSKANEEMSA